MSSRKEIVQEKNLAKEIVEEIETGMMSQGLSLDWSSYVESMTGFKWRGRMYKIVDFVVFSPNGTRLCDLRHEQIRRARINMQMHIITKNVKI